MMRGRTVVRLGGMACGSASQEKALQMKHATAPNPVDHISAFTHRGDCGPSSRPSANGNRRGTVKTSAPRVPITSRGAATIIT